MTLFDFAVGNARREFGGRMFESARDPLEGDAWEQRTPCATPGCDHAVTFPESEAFCSTCLIAQRNAAHQREQEHERAKPHAAKATMRQAEADAQDVETRR